MKTNNHFVPASLIALAGSALLVACSLFAPGKHNAASPTALQGTGVAASQGLTGTGATSPGGNSSSGNAGGNTAQNNPMLQLTPVETSQAFPGLYLPPDTLAQVTENTLSVVSDMPCSDLMDVLASGQWQEVERKHYDQGAFSDLSELSLGSNVAIARFNGGQCHATIDLLSNQTIKAKGPVNASGNSLEYPFMCLSDGQTTQIGMVYQGPGDVRTMINVTIPMQTGTSVITDTDNTSLGIGSLKASILDLLDLQTYSNTGNGSGDQGTPTPGTGNDSGGASPLLSDPEAQFNPGPDFQGQATIKSVDPLAGEITLSGMQNASNEEESISASFDCNQVVKFTDQSGPTSTPAPLPTDIPLPPNTVLSSNLKNQLINLSSSDTPDVVADFFKQSMPAQGWKLTQDDRSLQTIIMMTFTKGKQTLSVTITTKKDGTGSNVLLALN